MELRRKNTGAYETRVFEQSGIGSDAAEMEGFACIHFLRGEKCINVFAIRFYHIGFIHTFLTHICF